jgi:hypothetical protein
MRGGREPRERRTGPSGSAQVTARRFYREQRPPDFEGVGSPEIGRQYAMPIRARTEEPTFALSPIVIDRHKIRSGGSKAWAFGPEAIARWARCLSSWRRSLLGYASRTAAPRHGLATFRPLFHVVPCSTPTTQRMAPKSGSRHFIRAASPRVGWRLRCSFSVPRARIGPRTVRAFRGISISALTEGPPAPYPLGLDLQWNSRWSHRTSRSLSSAVRQRSLKSVACAF